VWLKGGERRIVIVSLKSGERSKVIKLEIFGLDKKTRNFNDIRFCFLVCKLRERLVMYCYMLLLLFLSTYQIYKLDPL